MNNDESEEEFRAILKAEDIVAVDELRELALNGVPDSIRGKVWRFLLGVSVSDVSEEELNKDERSQQYFSFHREEREDIKKIQGEINRYHRELSIFQDNYVKKMFEDVITAYLTQNSHVRYTPILVHLCGPLVYVYMSSKSDKETVSDIEPFVFYSFQSLLSRLQFDDPCQENSNGMLGNLVNFLRVLLPELHSHFEDEELETREWAHSWIHSLLSCELPLHCVLRLWDTYFSHEAGFSLHPYVCIAILFSYKEDLEEFDHSDLLKVLRKLRNMDIGKVIAQALNLRDEIREKRIV